MPYAPVPDFDLLDILFLNKSPPFNARRVAENQTDDRARDTWLKTHTKQEAKEYTNEPE